jgi:hypothetical protein
MAHNNPLPPMPEAPQHSNPFRPWVLPVLTALVVLAIVAWNLDSSNGLPVTNTPNTATDFAPLPR